MITSFAFGFTEMLAIIGVVIMFVAQFAKHKQFIHYNASSEGLLFGNHDLGLLHIFILVASALMIVSVLETTLESNDTD